MVEGPAVKGPPATLKPPHAGRRKAAVLLTALGPEAASSVFEHLREDEVEQLSAEMAGLQAGLQSIAPQERDDVLMELGEQVAANRWAAVEGPRHAGELPAGSARSPYPVAVPVTATPAALLRQVRGTAPERLHRLIRYAPIDTIALILAHLDPADACTVLGNLPVTTQADVAERIAALDRTAPELVREAARMLDAAEPAAAGPAAAGPAAAGPAA